MLERNEMKLLPKVVKHSEIGCLSKSNNSSSSKKAEWILIYGGCVCGTKVSFSPSEFSSTDGPCEIYCHN